MKTAAVPALKAVLALVALGAVAGCGLKGGLTMPERSTNVVVRGPGGTTAAGTETAPGTTAPGGTATSGTGTTTPGGTTAPAGSGTDSGTPKATTPGKNATGATPTTKVPKADRLPPPPLPGGNPGSAHGG